MKIKEDRTEYLRVHRWMRKNFGEATFCALVSGHTKAKRFEWANVSGQYLYDINDFVPMCPSCHRKYDYTEKQRELTRAHMKGNTNKRKKVKQFSKDGIFIKEYTHIQLAQRETGVINSAISNVLHGRAKTAGGFLWS